MILLVPAFLGVIGLLQGALNKQMGLKIGVAHAVFINMVLTFLFSILFYFFTLKFPKMVPEIFRVKVSLMTWDWWYLLPGLLGMLIVGLIPWAIAEVGMVKFTIILVAAQMAFSCIWDIYVEKIPLNLIKSLGLLMSFIGTLLVVKK